MKQYIGKQLFKIEDEDQTFNMKIEIDFGFTREGQNMESILKEQVLFWPNGARDIEINDGDYVKTYLEYMASEVKPVSRYWHIIIVKRTIKDIEGYYPINGEWGITLIQCSHDEEDINFIITSLEGDK